MNLPETRLLPLPRRQAALSAHHAFVSMPATAWYWLDDLIRQDYPGGYKDLVDGFQLAAHTPEDMSHALLARAEEHCTRQMEGLYNLANDNDRRAASRGLNAPGRTSPAHPFTPDMAAEMPSVFQLFRFIAHPTYLTTVWERRNYHLTGWDA